MANPKGDVTISIGVDSAGVGPGLAAAGNEFRRFGQTAQGAGHGLGSLSEMLREYRTEERMQSRSTRFFADELRNLIGVSDGTAGALGKLFGVLAGGVGVGGLIFEGVKLIAESYVEEKKKAEEAAAAAQKWADDHVAALAKVAQGFRDLAIAQASAGLGSAARDYVTKYRELQPKVNEADIAATDARAKVAEARANAARNREMAQQPRGPQIGALVDYDANARMYEAQAREFEKEAQAAEDKAADLHRQLGELQRQYDRTGRTLDILAEDERARAEAARKAGEKKPGAKDPDAWLADPMGNGPKPVPREFGGMQPVGPGGELPAFAGAGDAQMIAFQAVSDSEAAVNRRTLGDRAQFEKELKAREKAIEQFTKQAQRNMQNLLGDQLGDMLTGEWDGALDKMVIAWGKMLARMAAQAIASNILGAIFGGGSGGILGGLLGGSGPDLPSAALAGGGPVSAGKTYLVGERGPELFTADMSGRIIPNDALRAGGGDTYTVNVALSAIDTRTGAEFIRRSAPDIVDAIERERRARRAA